MTSLGLIPSLRPRPTVCSRFLTASGAIQRSGSYLGAIFELFVRLSRAWNQPAKTCRGLVHHWPVQPRVWFWGDLGVLVDKSIPNQKRVDPLELQFQKDNRESQDRVNCCSHALGLRWDHVTGARKPATSGLSFR